mmetsp:Transcript_46663/g.87019  ORF Transcript_46663/g.87019 Transcript_46663/m.87019 type:complete len:301 (+) Transcript_46663:150-1052(+)
MREADAQSGDESSPRTRLKKKTKLTMALQRMGSKVSELTGPQNPSFDVKVKKTGRKGESLGMIVSPDEDPRYLFVDDVWAPSLIGDWNSQQSSEDTKVQKGDLIAAVNNSYVQASEMLNVLQRLGDKATIKLTIERSEDLKKRIPGNGNAGTKPKRMASSKRSNSTPSRFGNQRRVQGSPNSKRSGESTEVSTPQRGRTNVPEPSSPRSFNSSKSRGSRPSNPQDAESNAGTKRSLSRNGERSVKFDSPPLRNESEQREGNAEPPSESAEVYPDAPPPAPPPMSPPPPPPTHTEPQQTAN